MSSFNLQSIVRPLLLSFQPYQSARDLMPIDEEDFVLLDANENAYAKTYGKYPDPQQKKLKKWLAVANAVTPNQIVLGNGSDELIDLILRAFCEPYQDEVIILPPTYGMYSVSAKLNAVRIQEVALTADFQIDVAQVMAKVSEKTKMIFICSPNNPSGNVVHPDSIAFLLKNFNGLVVVDEAYIDFSSSPSWVEKLSSFPNLIVLQTLSKAHGLAGLRIGMLFCSKEIVSLINTIKPPYNINVLSQKVALEVLEQGQWKASVKQLAENREQLKAQLSELTWVENIYPSEANFLLVKVDNAQLRYQQWKDQGIIVRNRNGQLHCDECLRITVGTVQENNLLINTAKTF